MNDEPSIVPPKRGDAARAGSLVRRVPLAVRIAVLVLVGLAFAAIAFDSATSSPRTCGACHEMSARVSSWSESAHNSVPCVRCHQEPTAWYELWPRVRDRAELLYKDVRVHFEGGFADPVDGPTGYSTPVSDDVCLDCHDPNRKATSGYRITIDHVEHAKRNGSCVSCHVRTAHPQSTRGTALSLMSQCYTCHGTPKYPEASTECATCHPSGFEHRPSSHVATGWESDHGDLSQSDEGLCLMCHQPAYCDSCHGVEMPHPAGWAGDPAGHPAVAQEDPRLCDRCHGGGPDLCSMCHHVSYDPVQGPWVDQHDLEVKQEGSDYCAKCHTRAYCSYCHTSLVVGD